MMIQSQGATIDVHVRIYLSMISSNTEKMNENKSCVWKRERDKEIVWGGRRKGRFSKPSKQRMKRLVFHLRDCVMMKFFLPMIIIIIIITPCSRCHHCRLYCMTSWIGKDDDEEKQRGEKSRSCSFASHPPKKIPSTIFSCLFISKYILLGYCI